MTRRRGRPTATKAFGAGARESHDSSRFYARFAPKAISADEQLAEHFELPEPLIVGDSRKMDELPDNSVALVVTSPPYFAGKEYEEALGQGVIPASYAAYLELLADVFAECRRVLEPGGRIAVNVANLGRKPYRSLAADVVRILDDDLGLLLRGEIVWRKAGGASGSCAWGSYRSPVNPVLRDVTERVVVASKGRFDRAVSVERRRAQGLPHEASITTDEFLEATLDVWDIRPESARRVHHPAPFPVELPQRLIELYTFRGDVVLDPFLGSGSAAVAAARTGRRYVGYDTEAEYVTLAAERVAAEAGVAGQLFASPPERALPAGRKAAAVVAVELLASAGFEVVEQDRRVPGAGVTVDVVARAGDGQPWYFDVTGAFTTTPAGLSRADVLWKAVGRASVLDASGVGPVVLVSSDLPARRSAGDVALRALGSRRIHDVVGVLDTAGHERLARYAAGGRQDRPLPGFWTLGELGPRAGSPS